MGKSNGTGERGESAAAGRRPCSTPPPRRPDHLPPPAWAEGDWLWGWRDHLTCDAAHLPSHRLVGLYYLGRCHPEYGYAWEAHATAGEALGLTERTVGEAMRALCRTGYFRSRRRRQATSLYEPTLPAQDRKQRSEHEGGQDRKERSEQGAEGRKRASEHEPRERKQATEGERKQASEDSSLGVPLLDDDSAPPHRDDAGPAIDSIPIAGESDPADVAADLKGRFPQLAHLSDGAIRKPVAAWRADGLPYAHIVETLGEGLPKLRKPVRDLGKAMAPNMAEAQARLCDPEAAAAAQVQTEAAQSATMRAKGRAQADRHASVMAAIKEDAAREAAEAARLYPAGARVRERAGRLRTGTSLGTYPGLTLVAVRFDGHAEPEEVSAAELEPLVAEAAA